MSELLLLEESKPTAVSGPLDVLQDIQSMWSLLKVKTRLMRQANTSTVPVDPTGVHHAFDEEQYSLVHQLLEKIHSIACERSWEWNQMGVLSPAHISESLQRYVQMSC